MIREFGRLYHEAWWAKRRDEGFHGREDLPRAFEPAAGLADAMQAVPCVVFAFALRGGTADSVIPAVQNLMLAARGVGDRQCADDAPCRASCPGSVRCSASPKTSRFHFCVPLGYPQGHFGPNRRKPTSETTFLNRWSAPVPWT